MSQYSQKSLYDFFFADHPRIVVMVKLLQTFDYFELRQEQDAPEGSVPPAFWKNLKGRAAYEQVWPRAAVTLYAKVHSFGFSIWERKTDCRIVSKGWRLDLHEDGKVSRVNLLLVYTANLLDMFGSPLFTPLLLGISPLKYSLGDCYYIV